MQPEKLQYQSFANFVGPICAYLRASSPASTQLRFITNHHHLQHLK
jgi:hypothetical protein